MVSVVAGVLGADLDVVFADWGVTVTYREVSQSYMPATQQIWAESYVNHAVAARMAIGHFHCSDFAEICWGG